MLARCRMVVAGLAGLGGLAGCAYVDPDPAWAARPGRFADAAFAPSDDDLRGIDPPGPEDRIENGDRIRYRVEFTKGGTTRVWLVHVTVLDARHDPIPLRDGGVSHRLRLDVRVDDASGAEVGRDVVAVSREQLVFGLFTACRGDPTPAYAAAGPFATLPVEMRATIALVDMLTVIRTSKVLFDVLWQVIDKPSILSVITHLGVSVRTDVQFDRAVALEPVTIDGQTFAAYELPVELRLNDVPALRSKLLVTETHSPLNLSAGILCVDAFQPSDPSARVTIRVVAARRCAADGSARDALP